MSRSEFIAIASPADPFQTEETAEVTLKDTADKKLPFKFSLSHYLVHDILKGELEVNKPIAVVPDNIEKKMYLQAMNYLKGVRKSPIYNRYLSQAKDIGEKELRILFLKSYKEGKLEYMGQEGLSFKGDIAEILKPDSKLNDLKVEELK